MEFNIWIAASVLIGLVNVYIWIKVIGAKKKQ